MKKYEVLAKDSRFAVYEDGHLGNQGFLSPEDALHSIWVDEGKLPTDFYRVKDGKKTGEVYLIKGEDTL